MHATGCLVAYLENKDAVLHVCHETIDNQVFVLTDLGEIRNHDLCMDTNTADGKVITYKCHRMGGNQKWVYDPKVITGGACVCVMGGIFSHFLFDKKILQTQTFRHSIGSCLQRDTAIEPWVNVKPCDGSPMQQWNLLNKNYKFKSEL